MHVAVKQPVAQGMGEEQVQDAVPDRFEVEVRSAEFFQIVRRDALGPVHRHHSAGTEAPVDARDDEARVFFGVLGELGRRRGLLPQIQLTQHHVFEMVDHVLRAQAAGLRQEHLDHARGEMEGVEVVSEGPFDAGAKHLDRDLFAGRADTCLVHLRDRGRRDRIGEVREDIVDFDLELAFDHPARDVGGEGVELVLQVLQLLGQFFAHDIGAGREDLPELDVGRAHRRHGAGHRRERLVAAFSDPCESPADRAGRDPDQWRGVHRVQHLAQGAGACERRADTDQAPDVDRAFHQIFQPECSAAIPIVRLRYFTCSNPAVRIMPAKVS